jgi:hypothetical protein
MLAPSKDTKPFPGRVGQSLQPRASGGGLDGGDGPQAATASHGRAIA